MRFRFDARHCTRLPAVRTVRVAGDTEREAARTRCVEAIPEPAADGSAGANLVCRRVARMRAGRPSVGAPGDGRLRPRRRVVRALAGTRRYRGARGGGTPGGGTIS